MNIQRRDFSLFGIAFFIFSILVLFNGNCFGFTISGPYLDEIWGIAESPSPEVLKTYAYNFTDAEVKPYDPSYDWAFTAGTIFQPSGIIYKGSLTVQNTGGEWIFLNLGQSGSLGAYGLTSSAQNSFYFNLSRGNFSFYIEWRMLAFENWSDNGILVNYPGGYDFYVPTSNDVWFGFSLYPNTYEFQYGQYSDADVGSYNGPVTIGTYPTGVQEWWALSNFYNTGILAFKVDSQSNPLLGTYDLYAQSTPVPEPDILILLGISMASIVGLRKWWKG